MRTPDDYDAYKDRQRQQDQARNMFLAVARLEDDASSPLSDRQLSDRVASLTGSRPAPEDVVKANRELFREAADYAWADGIRADSPITLAVASDPKNTPLPKDQYNHLASVERATGNLVAASKTIPDGTPWTGGWLSSPLIPNAELADEFAAVRRQDGPEREAVPSIWDNPGETPEAVQDGTMWNGGWADSPSIPRTDVGPSADLAADAAAIRQQAADQENDANPAPPGDQGNNNGLRPGEKVVEVQVVADEGAPIPSPSGNRGDLASDGGLAASSSAASQGSASSTEVSNGKVPDGGLRPGEKVVEVQVVSDEGGPAPSPPVDHGDPASDDTQGADSTSNVAHSSAGKPLRQVEPKASVAPNASTRGLATSTSFGEVPETQMPEEAGARSYNKGDAGRNEVVQKILGAKELSGKQFGILRRELKRQPFIDQAWAIQVADAVRYGKPSKEWLHEALLPHTLDREGKEVIRGVPPAALNSVGHATEAVGQLLHATESKARTALVEDIANAKGKSAEEIAALRRRIFDQHDINPADAQRFLSEVLAGDMDPDEARQALSPMLKEVSETLKNAGAGLEDYSKTVLPPRPGMKDSWGRGLSEAIGGAIPAIAAAAAAGPWAAWLYGALDTAGTQSSKARDAHYDPEMQAKAALLGLPLGLVANAPIADKVTKLPWLKKYADSWVDALALKPIANGLMGAGQEFGSNVIAQRTYDPTRDWWDGVAFSFATGAVVSGLEPGLKRAARLAITPVQRAIELHGMLNEMGDRLKAVPPMADGAKTARTIVEQKLTGTPAENVYVRADTFVDSLKTAGIDPWRFVLGLKGATLADLKAAVDAKGYVRIPTVTFAVDLIGTKAGGVLRPNLSFEPGGMTAADVEALTHAFKTPGALAGSFGARTANTQGTPFFN